MLIQTGVERLNDAFQDLWTGVIDFVPKLIIATHGHFDHILAARALQLAYKIPFMCHEGDTFLVDRMGETAKHFLGISVASGFVLLSIALQKDWEKARGKLNE